MISRHEWLGKDGHCFVGPTYASGSRRDLAEEILRLLTKDHETTVWLNNGGADEYYNYDSDPGDCHGS